jgi:hypothetical protein
VAANLGPHAKLRHISNWDERIFLKFWFLFFLCTLQTPVFAKITVDCRALMAEEQATSLFTFEGQSLIKKFGLTTETAAGLLRWTQARRARIFLRRRNPQASRFDEDPNYYPKESDVPFKSGADGLVRAVSANAYFQSMGRTPYTMKAWSKWQQALALRKYFVDDEGLIHIGSQKGPIVYSDLDVYAVFLMNADGALIPFTLGSGSENRQEMNRLFNRQELNDAARGKSHYDLIQHGSQIEFQLPIPSNSQDPLLELDEQGLIRVSNGV